MHLIDPERLAAIVDRTTTRTIGIRQRVTLREKIALLVQWSERFVSDLMIEEHKLTEIRS